MIFPSLAQTVFTVAHCGDPRVANRRCRQAFRPNGCGVIAALFPLPQEEKFNPLKYITDVVGWG
jgi:hypothetical protein